jgi:hypothetical protein
MHEMKLMSNQAKGSDPRANNSILKSKKEACIYIAVAFFCFLYLNKPNKVLELGKVVSTTRKYLDSFTCSSSCK